MAFACKPVVKRAGSLLESLSILRITPTNEDLKTAWIRTAWQSTSSWTAELPGRQLEVLFKPIRQLLAGNAASCQSQHQSLLIIDVGDQLAAIQQDEDLHRCVRGPFVAIEEWVIQRQREAEGGRLRGKRCVKIRTPEAGPGLCERRFERAKIPDAGGAA